MTKLKNAVARAFAPVAAVTTLALVSMPAHAVLAFDVTDITTFIDGPVTTGIIAIAVAALALHIGVRAYKKARGAL